MPDAPDGSRRTAFNGPVVPAGRPKPGSSACWVVLALRGGAPDSMLNTAFSPQQIKTRHGLRKMQEPEVGLFAIPVGMLNPKQRVPLLNWLFCALALRKMDSNHQWRQNSGGGEQTHADRSRRETLPCDSAVTISARFFACVFCVSESPSVALFGEPEFIILSFTHC